MNADVVRSALAHWNTRPEVTEEAFAEFGRPDMVIDITANVFNPGTFEGFEGFVRFADQVREAWAEFRLEPDEVFEQGDLVVVLGRGVGIGHESGVEIAPPSPWCTRCARARSPRCGSSRIGRPPCA